MIPKCVECGCEGNRHCNYPPPILEHDNCSLDDCGSCPCCGAGINRMDYRPEEDGQEVLPL